jgi:hypothetical protein
VAIPWPVREPLLAEKDARGSPLQNAECYS